MPKIPKKHKQAVSSSASPRSPVQDDNEEGERLVDVGNPNWDGDRQPPEWYSKLKAITKRDTGHGNVQVLLERLKGQIGKIKKLPRGAKAERKASMNELREIIHKVFFIEVTPQILRNLRMLHNNDGLPQPYDLKADAEELYNKWCARTFEIDLLRGIMVGKPKTAKDKGSSDRLNAKFPKVPSNYYGNGRLLNGQWWPTQLTALRDGAYGSSQGGIYGETGKGAYSIVMSGGVDKAGNKYPDVDEGDHVQYCGTDNDGPTNKPSDGTQRLIESYRFKTPVRLIRSSNADPAYAPEEGFRYDGLYEIVDMERMDPPDSKRQRHRFTLRRRPGQDPIRGSGPEKRPTQQELDAYKKDKTLRGYGAKGS
ncbi:E3 ubiquitin-protein ligase ORTHRUS 2 [Pseudocercospora fuligena]|uniref:E3 ubiquitin-protein ligase ORTHRUS 2 n=1 Tax=Pseudocercospora fuligena TaxID=685502 RepID=A0A8H6VN23_9PEZI|nr:E3 ubiquitin-protein ligase ORTHRUS 2 [Pseudocercospora fuligena]